MYYLRILKNRIKLAKKVIIKKKAKLFLLWNLNNIINISFIRCKEKRLGMKMQILLHNTFWIQDLMKLLNLLMNRKFKTDD
jgi:hypothetical protein